MDLMPANATPAVALFDYGSLGASAEEARAIAARYRARSKSYIMDTGRDLLSMKERLEHGLFLKWVEAELNLTARTAQNFMQAASHLGDKSEIVSHLPPTILYQLSSPSTPEPVRAEIVERLGAGEALTPRAIGNRLWEARAEAKREEAEAKLTPEERKRQAQSKKAAEARRQREHEKYQAEMAAAAAEREAASKELATILLPLLDQDAYHRVYEIFPKINIYSMRKALVSARYAGGNGRPVLNTPMDEADA